MTSVCLGYLKGRVELHKLNNTNKTQTEFLDWQIAHAKEVKVLPMADIPELLGIPDNVWMEVVNAKDCHNNAAKILSMLVEYDRDACMVSGLALGVIPVDHSWIKVGDKYFDPTWEIHSDIGEEYLAICELDIRSLCLITDRDEDLNLWEICGIVYTYYTHMIKNQRSDELVAKG